MGSPFVFENVEERGERRRRRRKRRKERKREKKRRARRDRLEEVNLWLVPSVLGWNARVPIVSPPLGAQILT